MKYMLGRFELPQASPAVDEGAQERSLEVFGECKAPEGFKIEVFAVRVGAWGRHRVFDWNEPAAIDKVRKPVHVITETGNVIIVTGVLIKDAGDRDQG